MIATRFATLVLALLWPGAAAPASAEGDMVLFDFSREADVARFRAIHDVVMGGVSTGGLVADEDGHASFRGVVSLENNGGFASIRSLPQRLDLGAHGGIRIRVRGDGQRYKLNLKMNGDLDGVQYRAAFRPPAGEWIEIDLPFEEFVPTFRGRVLRDVDPLDPSRIATIGFLISDQQAGPFRLDVAWIRTIQ